MKSAIYEGRVRHRRHSPAAHAFAYRFYMMYVDLAEIDTLFRGRWLWSSHRPALARFKREDHLGDPAIPLDRAVRNLVEQRTGRRPTGPIRLLTQLRQLGYCFNPVSFYYCFDRDERLEAIVAEVNNTPWGERHCYVLRESMNDDRTADFKRYRPAKALHVSPFMPMDIDYDWRFSIPGERLSVHMENYRGGEKLFDATLALERTPITTTSLARVLITYPFMTGVTIAGIYWQALRLWLKRVPVYDHPERAARATDDDRCETAATADRR